MIQQQQHCQVHFVTESQKMRHWRQKLFPWRHSSANDTNTEADSAQSSNRETETDILTCSHKWDLCAVQLFLRIMRIFILTLHRLQRWNSSFSAACQLMDSSESVNSVLNGASTCFTYADWACVWMCVFVCSACRLSSTPAASANVPCLFLAHTPPSQTQGGETARGWGRKGGGDGPECGLLTMPVSQGTRSMVAAFLPYRQHPPPSLMSRSWGGFDHKSRLLVTW